MCSSINLTSGFKVLFFDVLNRIFLHRQEKRNAMSIADIVGSNWRHPILLELLCLHVHPLVRQYLLDQMLYPQLVLAASGLNTVPLVHIRYIDIDGVFSDALSTKGADTDDICSLFYLFLQELPRLMRKKFTFNFDRGLGVHAALSHTFKLLPGRLRELSMGMRSHYLIPNHFCKLTARMELIITMCFEEYIAEKRMKPHMGGDLSVSIVWKMTDEDVENLCKEKVMKNTERPLYSSENMKDLRVELEVDSLVEELKDTKSPGKPASSASTSNLKPSGKQSRKKKLQSTPNKTKKRTLDKDEAESEEELSESQESNSSIINAPILPNNPLPKIVSLFIFGEDGIAEPKPKLSTSEKKLVLDTMKTSSFPFLLNNRFYQMITASGSQKVKSSSEWCSVLRNYKVEGMRSRSELWEPEEVKFVVDDFVSKNNTNKLKMAMKVLTELNKTHPILVKRLWSQCKYGSEFPNYFEKLTFTFVCVKGNDPVKVQRGVLAIRDQLSEEQLKKELIKYLDFDSTLIKPEKSPEKSTTNSSNKIVVNSESVSSNTQGNTPNNNIPLISNAESVNQAKPTPIMDTFKEVEILKSKDGNIDLKGLLENDAEFLAFDLELTGIGALRGPNGPPSIEERVNAVKANSIVQVGLMFMRQVKSSKSSLMQFEQV